MSRPLQLQYVASVVSVEQLPPTRAEIAFVGRSNVGKSSLLNAIAGSKNVARVSNSPGRTQTLDCFAHEKGGTTVVDCPGYGYAKVPKATRKAWLPMLEHYLLEREGLAKVLLLVDGEIGPTASDLYMLEWLRGNEVPMCVVATKLDKVKSSHRLGRQKEFAANCELPPADIVWVSAAKEMGIAELRELVRGWLA